MGSVRTPEEEEADGTASAGKSYPHFPSSSSSSSSSSSAAAAAAPPRRWQNDSHNSSRFHNDYSIHHHPPPPSPYHYERRVRETVINGTTWYPQLPRSGPNPRHYRDPHDGSYQQHPHRTMHYDDKNNDDDNDDDDDDDVVEDDNHDGSYFMHHHGRQHRYDGPYDHRHPYQHQHDGTYAMMPYYDGGMYGSHAVAYDDGSAHAPPWYYSYDHNASMMRRPYNNAVMPHHGYNVGPRGGYGDSRSQPGSYDDGRSSSSSYIGRSPRGGGYGDSRSQPGSYDDGRSSSSSSYIGRSPRGGGYGDSRSQHGSYDNGRSPRGGGYGDSRSQHGSYDNGRSPHGGDNTRSSRPRSSSHGGQYVQEENAYRSYNNEMDGMGGWPLYGMRSSGNTSRHVVTWCGHTMPVTITSQAAVVIEWVLRQTGGLFGFDLEWKPNFSPGQDNKAALLQLCGPEDCLIVQLLYADMIPRALVDFLLDAGKSLGGVGIRQDVSKLERDHGLACQGQVELGVLASEKLQRQDLHGGGLKKLVDQVLGKTLVKVKKITMSNWEKEYLDQKQIEYACIDAWAALALLQKLMG